VEKRKQNQKSVKAGKRKIATGCGKVKRRKKTLYV
jgi:hypothetical protein